MKRIPTFTIILLCLAGLRWGRAAESPLEISSNRFLFIVETSKAMKPQMPAAGQSVAELLMSGLGGQLRRGDTIGLWTYDSELHTGVFPMQIWREGQQQFIADMAAAFLNQQKPKGRARLAQVLPPMLRLFAESEALTVLLYTDGSELIQGTPFDDSINEVFKQHRDELRDAHIPFVTVLVGRAGKIVKCTMNSAVGVSVPALPLPGENTNPPPAKVATEAPRPLLAKTNPPLIVDYSKSNLAVAAASSARKEHLPLDTGAALKPPESAAGKIRTSPPPTVVLQPLPPETHATEEGQSVATEESRPIDAPTTAAVDVASPTSPPEVSRPAPIAPEKIIPPVPLPSARPPTVAPAEPGKSTPILGLVMVGVGLTLIAVLLWLLVVRAKAAPKGGGSLITKSFDRGKKP